MRIVFAGTPDFSAVSLRALLAADAPVVGVLTQPDRPAGRGRRLTASAVKRLALEHDLPVRQPVSLKKESGRQALAEFQPTLLIVAAYGLILPPAILDMPLLGCINVHASLLPRWRGAAPIQRAVEAGDEETGICLMQMEAGLDTGPVLASRRLAIGAHETAGELHDRLAATGAALLVETLPAICSGSLLATPQPSEGATYAERLQKNEAWLDWSLPAEVLERKVRAFNPWPVARSALGDERLKIWRARCRPGNDGTTPGTIVVAERNRLEVATGDGRLALEQVQRPGGKPLASRDFLNASSISRGARLQTPDDAGA